MPYREIREEGMPIPVKSWAGEIESTARQQAIDLTRLSCARQHVALMPDCHVGFGMPIGGVLATENAAIPMAVGVDIGCGMNAWKTSLKRAEVEPKLREIMRRIKRDVPVGRQWRRNADEAGRLSGVEVDYDELKKGHRRGELEKIEGFNDVCKQLGTLGGGNHFVEVQLDRNDGVWVMLHSGSRHMGKEVGDRYRRLAQERAKREKTELPSRDLAFLTLDSDEGDRYWRAMEAAMLFARMNRAVMMDVCREAFRREGLAVDESFEVNIHHNYAAREQHFGRELVIHRKGATSARAGEPGIIPGSMGSRSYIVRGLGNPDSFASCSHGAGRTMSRSAARKKISMDQFRDSMKGIMFDLRHSAIDEAPMAYKEIGEVMSRQTDLVEIVEELRPIAVMKG